MLDITIGICAYNEGKNIGKLLDRLSHEKFNFNLKEIIVVASGCTDETASIVKKISAKNGRVKLIIEKTRKGKASAINLILRNAKGEIIVFLDGDDLPENGSINKLISGFSQANIGGVTSMIIPLKASGITGYVVNLIWRLHHKINLRQPKLNGQLYALRKFIVNAIPRDIICDDAYIEAIVRKRGYKTIYLPEAAVNIEIPKNLMNVLKQRRRVSRGYVQLSQLNIDVTVPYKIKFKLVINEIQKNPFDFPKIFLAVFIEALANILAYYDTLSKRTPYCWEKVA